MLKATIYNQEGQAVGEQELNEKIWGVKPEVGLIHEALRVQSGNARQVLAHTKKRGEVRGGGKKPWKQKGTGRARQGSIRSPLWRGGGVIFGPLKNRNFSLKMNKKAHRKAILMCLSDKLAGNHLLVLDKLELKEAKTKALVQVLKQLPLENKKTLIALSSDNKSLNQFGKNISRVQLISAESLNVKDLLASPFLLTTKTGVATIEKKYGGVKFSS
ncbi:MAG: 50S ribosomal protein L4 [bacterium]|nr:50S ribosomal protein L4 [bacterium]